MKKLGSKHDPARSLGPRYAAPAVDQALDIVELLSHNSHAYGINELSRTLKISTNTVFRIVRRLTERGYTELDAAGGYRLGTRFFSLGMRLQRRFDLRLRSRVHLEWLCEQTHETCQIHVPDKDRMLVLDSMSPPAEFFLQTTPGSRFHYHPNAFGKAVLAFWDAEAVQAVIPEELPALTPHTITTRRELLNHLKQVRQTGIAYDMQEYNTGFFCIGAPVFDVTGMVVAGIGITGVLQADSSSRFQERERLVLDCAARISADIGYDGDRYAGFAKAKGTSGSPRNRKSRRPHRSTT
jgi:DNA-binding IclR family transcriptional regulator